MRVIKGPRSGSHRRTRPLLGSVSSEEAECLAGEEVTLEVEGVVHGERAERKTLR
jgi:hypothetical protein